MDLKKLKELPKAELHCHLDGSLPESFISGELGRKIDPSELVCSMDCKSLNEYLEKFDLPIESLHSKDSIARAAYEVMKSAAAENVRYIELRYAPATVVKEGFTAEDSVQGITEGIKMAEKDYKIKGNAILCAMRHLNPESNRAILDLTEKYLGRGVCCMDLAGAEAVYPTKDFEYLFTKAYERHVPVIIHAGECGDPESVRAAIGFHARRIGHGIAIAGHEDLIKLVRETDTALEVCPLSNFQTKAFKGNYPLRELIDAGVKVTINTDNRTVSDTSLTKDLKKAVEVADLTDKEVIQLERNAVNASFADQDTKNAILEELKIFEERNDNGEV